AGRGLDSGDDAQVIGAVDDALMDDRCGGHAPVAAGAPGDRAGAGDGADPPQRAGVKVEADEVEGDDAPPLGRLAGGEDDGVAVDDRRAADAGAVELGVDAADVHAPEEAAGVGVKAEGAAVPFAVAVVGGAHRGDERAAVDGDGGGVLDGAGVDGGAPDDPGVVAGGL